MSPLFWTCLSGAAALCATAALLVFVALGEARRVHLRLDAVDRKLATLKLQVGNLISMLLRAGFKRGKTVDWSDDSTDTQHVSYDSFTKWDWRKPKKDDK